MKTAYTVWSVTACVCLLLAGCGVEVPEAPQKKMVEEVTFSAAVSNLAVEIEETALADRSQAVVADFNLDGLNDVALVEAAGNDKNEVTLYMREKPSEEYPRQTVYRRAGTIQAPGNGNIVGVASRRRETHTDLIILFRETGGTTELVHFLNKGDRLVRVDG